MKNKLFFKGLQNNVNTQISSPHYQETYLHEMNGNGASRFNLIRQTIPEETENPPSYTSLFNVQKL
jgi:hypothetical protein